MKRGRVAIVGLTFALLASNAWWAYHAVDAGVSSSYLRDSLETNERALAQALDLLPAVANPSSTRAQILEAAQRHAGGAQRFEKDGYIWVGAIGLKFDDTGRLRKVARAWSD